MDFKEFVKEVSEKIRDFLPDWLKDVEIKINEVTKNNGLMLLMKNKIRQKQDRNLCLHDKTAKAINDGWCRRLYLLVTVQS